MNALSFSSDRIIPSMRWLARLLSVLLIFLIISLAIGEGYPGPGEYTFTDLLLFVVLLFMLAGFIVAWWFEGIGSIMIIGGFILFLIINSLETESLSLGIFFGLFPLTALLFSVCCWRSKKAIVDESVDSE